jgi:hypothetical protein
MLKYVTLPFNKKLNLMHNHDISGGWPNLEHRKWCLHCGKSFDGHSVRVWQDDDGSLGLECGTPACDGLPIDWAEYPWWDPKHPATRQYLREERKRKRDGGKPSSDADDVPF